MKKKHILVTGGAGFIGSNLVSNFLDKGDAVWAVDMLQTGRKENIESHLSNPLFQFDHADLRTWSKLQEAINWADQIYHMAASIGQKYVIANPIETLSNNISSYERLLETLAKSRSKARLLLASTSGLYGHSQTNPDGSSSEDSYLSFPSEEFIQVTYPLGKLVNETMSLAYVEKNGVDCTIIRIFNTIGLRQTSAYGMVVPTFIEQALVNKPITIYGDGLQTRSFNSVHDSVRAMELLLDNPQSKGQIVNLGNETECAIIDLAKMIIRITGSKSEIRYIPYKEAYGVDFVDIRSRRPDLKKLKQLTGFMPQYTLEDIIHELVRAAELKNAIHR